jgi:hypothetical protein
MAITKEEAAAAGAGLAIAHAVGNPLVQMLQNLANVELPFSKVQRQAFRAQYLLTKQLLTYIYDHIRDVPQAADAELKLGDAHQAQADLAEAMKLSGRADLLLAAVTQEGEQNELTGVAPTWSDEDRANVEARLIALVQQIRAKLATMP